MRPSPFRSKNGAVDQESAQSNATYGPVSRRTCSARIRKVRQSPNAAIVTAAIQRRGRGKDENRQCAA